MKPVCRTNLTRSRMPSLLLCCVLALVACDKKEDTDTANSSRHTGMTVTDKQAANNDFEHPVTDATTNTNISDNSYNTQNTNNADGENTGTVVTQTIEHMPVIMCDDQLALTQLIQTVRASIHSQSQKMLNHYIDSTDIARGAADTHASASAMLVDIAKPKQISAANSNGLITCNASLSLTLPTKDVYRARDIYKALNGDSLNRRLQAQNVLMNNNMLVTNTFTYVVGMQSGQTITRTVGQPPILAAVADIIAKSQFKAAVDATQPNAYEEPSNNKAVNNANKVAINRPAQPAQSAQPSQPPSPARVTNPDEVNGGETLQAVEPKQSDSTDKPVTPSAQSTPSTNNDLKGDASVNNDKTQRSGSDAASKSRNKSQDTDMVITQDEGTY